ncbi:hypothetical protein SMICM304S_06419 [Streptomyces microflavus]
MPARLRPRDRQPQRRPLPGAAPLGQGSAPVLAPVPGEQVGVLTGEDQRDRFDGGVRDGRSCVRKSARRRVRRLALRVPCAGHQESEVSPARPEPFHRTPDGTSGPSASSQSMAACWSSWSSPSSAEDMSGLGTVSGGRQGDEMESGGGRRAKVVHWFTVGAALRESPEALSLLSAPAMRSPSGSVTSHECPMVWSLKNEHCKRASVCEVAEGGGAPGLGPDVVGAVGVGACARRTKGRAGWVRRRR